MFPDVFTCVTDAVIAAPPDWNVTTGVAIVSLAVNVSVTTSATLARVVVELLDAIPTLLKVGAVVSTQGNTLLFLHVWKVASDAVIAWPT
jgi:hypothetical protein